MSLRIRHLVVYVFAIIVSGTIKAIGVEVAKDPHRLSDYFARARETTLSSLVGRFIVVGIQPVTCKTYRGSVTVTRQGNSLHVRELIDGEARIGIGTIDVGDYRIVGEDTGTGRVYTGKVRVQFIGKRLTIDGLIDRKIARGEMVCFTDSKPIMIKYRVGARSMLSFAGEYGVGDNYPRICGYFYPVSDSSQAIPNSSPRLETWFFDWKTSE